MELALSFSVVLFSGCNQDIHTVHNSDVCQGKIQPVNLQRFALNFASFQLHKNLPNTLMNVADLGPSIGVFYRCDLLSSQVLSVLETR